MVRDPNLDKYFTPKKSLPFLEIVMVIILIGVLANFWMPGEDGIEVEAMVGMAIGSEEFNGNNYLLVELGEDDEILVKLPSHRQVKVGADVRVLKVPADPLTGLKWNYHFNQYIE